MPSFDVLDPATSIDGKRFLQASAGTGKTFTIEHVVLRLVTEKAVPIGSILVVTFTRKATEELKSRILSNFEKAYQHPELFPYLDASPEKKIRYRFLIKKALLEWEHVSIYTIHGFCYSVLERFSLESSSFDSLSFWEEEEEKEACMHFIQAKLPTYLPHQSYHLLRTFAQDKEAMASFLLRSSSSHTPSDIAVLYREFQEILRIDSMKDFRQAFHIQEEHYKNIGELKRKFPLQLLFECTDKQSCSLEELDSLLLADASLLEYLDSSHLKVKSQHIEEDPVFKNNLQRILSILKKGSNRGSLKALLLRDWQEKKAEQKKLSPDLLLKKTADLVDNPSFCKKITSLYEAVLIDEFQDTDPLQWKIFDRLFSKNSLKAFYLIGDPKQAIYGFRQADIYTFLKASSQFPHKEQLSVNYRSSAKLIEQLNKLFCHQPWLYLPQIDSHLEVDPVQSFHSGEGECHFLVIPKEEDLSPLEAENYFLHYIAYAILQHKGSLQEIAILVKDRFQLSRTEQFLKNYSIPILSSHLSKKLFLEVKKTLGLFFLTLQTLHPYYIKQLFLSSLFCSTLEELTSPSFGIYLEKIVLWKQIITEEGLIAWLHSVDKAFIQRLYTYKGKEFVDQAISILTCLGNRKNLIEISRRLEHLPYQPLASMEEKEGVQVMTTHASKGLEFSVVFTLGSAFGSEDKEEKNIIEKKEEQAELLRQFYVACTRAKTALFLPLIEGNLHKKSSKKDAPLELFLQTTNSLFTNYSHTFLSKELLLSMPLASRSPPPLESSLKKTSSLSFFSAPSILSFSSLKKNYKPLLSSLSTTPLLPSNAEIGTILHQILEKSVKNPGQIPEILLRHAIHPSISPFKEQIEALIMQMLQTPLDNFCLNEVDPQKMYTEMPFIFPHSPNLREGVIDLWFFHNNRYYIVDWKTHYLDNYTPEALSQLMDNNSYFLQADMYTKALSLYCERFGVKDFSSCFGGFYFGFVRAGYWLKYTPPFLSSSLEKKTDFFSVVK